MKSHIETLRRMHPHERWTFDRKSGLYINNKGESVHRVFIAGFIKAKIEELKETRNMGVYEIELKSILRTLRRAKTTRRHDNTEYIQLLREIRDEMNVAITLQEQGI